MSDETIMRGVKLHLYPNKRQQEILDDWRHKTIRLWNLLLELQKAAYSGEDRRAELGWRRIWADCLHEQYETDKRIWDHGRPPGPKRKGIEAGHIRMQQYELATEAWAAMTPEEQKASKKPVAPKAPQPPSEEKLDAILARNFPKPTLEQELGLRAKMSRATVRKKQREFRRANNPMRFHDQARREQAEKRIHDANIIVERHLQSPQDYEEQAQPKLFLWDRELLAIIARLKQVPQTTWIADLPSHASQRVVKDHCTTIKRMLSHGTGFPKFQTARRGDGSVYFANTQLTAQSLIISADEHFVALPKGIGRIRLEACEKRLTDKAIAMTARKGRPQFKSGGVKKARQRIAERIKGGKLQGARIYRHGDGWMLSLQYKLPKPAPLPATGQTAGVKIAAAVLLTTADDKGRTRQVDSLKMSQRQACNWRHAELRKSRQEEARKKKEAKLRARAERQGKHLRKRLRPTQEYQVTLDKMAHMRAVDNEKRRRHMHRETTRIVRQYDELTVQKWQVAPLMRKPRRKAKKRAEQVSRRARVASVRKIIARAAPAATELTLKYKAIDGGRVFNETPADFKDVQTCSVCGTENPKMRDGRRTFSCEACGNKLHKDKNAAKNEYKLGQEKRRKQDASVNI